MEKQELQKLRDLPIEGVAERLGLEVTRHKCLCPFHADKHPSMTFNVRKNTGRCYVCMNETIGTIDLVMKVLNKDFKEACEWLADSSNIILTNEKEFQASGFKDYKPFDASRYVRFFEHPYLSAKAQNFLFEERKLDPRVVRWCRLTSWADKEGVNWLQTPYCDMEGHLTGIQNRNLDYTPECGQPRFRFPYGAKCAIYNLPILKRLREGEPLYITEGCSDCWAMLSAGHKAIAIPSATLLKPSDLEVFETLKPLGTPLRMYPDNDEPGERLFMQLKDLTAKIGLELEHLQLPAGCKDYSDCFVRFR